MIKTKKRKYLNKNEKKKTLIIIRNEVVSIKYNPEFRNPLTSLFDFY